MNRTPEELLARIERNVLSAYPSTPATQAFQSRLKEHFPLLYHGLVQLYGSNPQFLYSLEDLIDTLCRMSLEGAALPPRPLPVNPEEKWFDDNQQIGMTLYTELFAGNLKKLEKKIDYFQELGITYLHLMPIFRCPEGENDGGYAVSSFQEIRSDLGTMKDLRRLAEKLNRAGIRLVIDFILNHTADDHPWAVKAKDGDPFYQDYYYLFTEEEKQAYAPWLRDIFPEVRKGSFTWLPEHGRWVWTTFNSFQWDLNYQNPEVFRVMTEQMISLANNGADVLRLDALAFTWKQKGTGCENLPEAHTLIQAFRSCAAIAAPSLVFKSEAIVHPDDVVKYIAPVECELSYNPLLMANIWEALATRETRLLYASLEHRLALPKHCAWVNYLRCHDDIGWTFADEDAYKLGINAYDHRRFLNQFYKGSFPGSFSRGLPFQENPDTGDLRITGTAASLAGLEKALKEETEHEVELAIRRLLLAYGLLFTMPGIPLINQGDELATLNDYEYTRDPEKAGDSRWVHRVPMNWRKAAARHRPETVTGKVFSGMKALILRRKSHPALGNGETLFHKTSHSELFVMERIADEETLIVLANLSERTIHVTENELRLIAPGAQLTDVDSGEETAGTLTMEPYRLHLMIKKPLPRG